MEQIALNKESSNEQIKQYFEAVLNSKQSGEDFPIALNEVWGLVYSRKDKAVRALTSNFTKDTDYQISRLNGEQKGRGGHNEETYMLSTSCLEHFVARKYRPVFEVYRKVFHKAVEEKKTLNARKSRKEILTMALQAEEELEASKEPVNAQDQIIDEFEPQTFSEALHIAAQQAKQEEKIKASKPLAKFVDTDKGEMVNATEMAKAYGKEPRKWLELPSTKAFIKVISENLCLAENELVTSVRGGNKPELRGNWMHEDVAMEFARWLSPHFAIWCNDRIKELMKHGVTAINPEDMLDPDYAIKAMQNLKKEREERGLMK